jgi:hypothetical protein
MRRKNPTKFSVGMGPHERKRLRERHGVDVKLILRATLITRMIMKNRLYYFMIG